MSSNLNTFHLEKQTSEHWNEIGSAPRRDNYCAILVSMSCWFRAAYVSIVSRNLRCAPTYEWKAFFFPAKQFSQKESNWAMENLARQEWEQIAERSRMLRIKLYCFHSYRNHNDRFSMQQEEKYTLAFLKKVKLTIISTRISISNGDTW